MDTRVDALRRWQGLDLARADLTAPQKLADAYSSALASALLREPDRADAAFSRVRSLMADSGRPEARAARWVAMLQAQLLLARGDAEAAATAMKPLASDTGRAVQLMNADIALGGAGGEVALRRSAEELQTRVAVQPSDAGAWAALGRVWAKLDQPLRALRAEGESVYALGDLRGAIDRLRAGQRVARPGNPSDFIEVSVIDARLRDIQGQLRALMLEQQEQQR